MFGFLIYSEWNSEGIRGRNNQLQPVKCQLKKRNPPPPITVEMNQLGYHEVFILSMKNMRQNYQSLAGEVRACEVKVYSVLYVDICMQVTVMKPPVTSSQPTLLMSQC